MTTLAENVRTFLLGQAAISQRIGARVCQDFVPQGFRRPYIYFERMSVRHERVVDEEQGTRPFSQTFAVACVADTLYEAEQLADAIRTVDGYRGTFGDSAVQATFVGEQDDQFDRERLGSDAGRHLRILTVEVIP